MSKKSEYKRVRKNLLAKARSANKRGYIIPQNLIPPIPEKIRVKDIRALQSISEDFYNLVQWKAPTGEILTGAQGRYTERWRAYQKGLESRKTKREKDVENEWYKNHDKGRDKPPEQIGATLDWVREQLSSWDERTNWSDDLKGMKRQDKNALENVLNSAIKEFGEERVAKNIQENGLEVQASVNEILYESGDGSRTGFTSGRSAVDFFLGRLKEVFTSSPVTVEESKKFNEYGELINTTNEFDTKPESVSYLREEDGIQYYFDHERGLEFFIEPSTGERWYEGIDYEK